MIFETHCRGRPFEGKRGPKVEAAHENEDRLFGEIGRLKMELDWIKKVESMSCAVRLAWIERNCGLTVGRQYELVGVLRTTVYRPRHSDQPNADDMRLCALIDEEYTRHPFYSSRRMVVILLQQGFLISRKRVQRLMRLIGLAGMAPEEKQGSAVPLQVASRP